MISREDYGMGNRLKRDYSLGKLLKLLLFESESLEKYESHNKYVYLKFESGNISKRNLIFLSNKSDPRTYVSEWAAFIFPFSFFQLRVFDSLLFSGKYSLGNFGKIIIYMCRILICT